MAPVSNALGIGDGKASFFLPDRRLHYPKTPHIPAQSPLVWIHRLP
jgi:hypothetical protein